MLIILVAIFAPVFATITGHGVNQQFRTTGLSPFGLPVGPGRDVPPGDRRPGPRHPGPDRLRRPHLAVRRRGRHPDRPSPSVPCSGWPPASSAASSTRSSPGSSTSSCRCRTCCSPSRLVSISQPEPHHRHHRHRPLRVGGGGPDRPGPGAVHPGEGVRRGGPLSRRQARGGSCSSTSCRT